MQEAGHLVDERARTARARTVHPLLDDGVEERDLRILTAELDDHVGRRLEALDRSRTGDDLLDELHAHHVGDAEAGRAGDGAVEGLVREGLGDLVEQGPEGAASVGVVASVRAEAQRVFIEHHRFDGGRSHIQTERKQGVLRSERSFCTWVYGNRASPATSSAPEERTCARGERRYPRKERKYALGERTCTARGEDLYPPEVLKVGKPQTHLLGSSSLRAEARADQPVLLERS